MFEIAEMMILLEKRTFLYHFSGIIAGLIYCAVSFNWCTLRFPGSGIPLGGRLNSSTIEVQRQRVSEPWTRSWGYGVSRLQPIRDNNVMNATVSPNDEGSSLESIADSDSNSNTGTTNSEYSSDGSIDGIPIPNSQSPPTFTYGGERTDERDMTLSPPVNSYLSNDTSPEQQIIPPHGVRQVNENENDQGFANSAIQNFLNVPPPPSYFSGSNPPQVPVGLGGGTYMSEESQSEDENESSSNSTDDTDDDQNSSDRGGYVQGGYHNSPAQEPLTVTFDNSVLNIEDLRRRRIQRFS